MTMTALVIERVMPAQFPDDLDVLTGLVHEAFPRASSVSIGRASGGRVVVVYRARVDGVRYYLRLAEEPGEDLTTDALVLERLGALTAGWQARTCPTPGRAG